MLPSIETGFDYAVEYSTDLVNWFSDLPDSSKTAPLTQKIFEYTDATSPKPVQRYYRVRRTPVGGGSPSTVQHESRDSEGDIMVTWSAHAGHHYQVEYSDDHQNWLADLPESSFTDVTADGTISFVDSGAGAAPTRLYRLIRTNS